MVCALISRLLTLKPPRRGEAPAPSGRLKLGRCDVNSLARSARHALRSAPRHPSRARCGIFTLCPAHYVPPSATPRASRASRLASLVYPPRVAYGLVERLLRGALASPRSSAFFPPPKKNLTKTAHRGFARRADFPCCEWNEATTG